MENRLGFFFDFWLDSTVNCCGFHIADVLQRQHEVKYLLFSALREAEARRELADVLTGVDRR